MGEFFRLPGSALPAAERLRLLLHKLSQVMLMTNPSCDPLALTTTVNSLAVAIASRLNDEELGLVGPILTQLGDTLETIAAQRAICAR